jgi:CRISPR-associated protein Cas1
MQHKDRTPSLFLGPGELFVENNGLHFSCKDSGKTAIPVEQFSALFLEPGTTITHSAVKLCAEHGCILSWVGEEGVRFYSAGLSHTKRVDRLWLQAEMALNKNKRMSVARRMYAFRFGNISALNSYNIEQLSGLEAGHVKNIYVKLATEVGITWEGRSFLEVEDTMKARVNLCISTVNSCLYGLSYAAILAAGYSPALGFIHGKTSQAFVYDIADLVKFKMVTPIAFQVAADLSLNEPSREARIQCRDLFKKEKLVDLLIDTMDAMLGYQSSIRYARNTVLPAFEVHEYAHSIIKKDPA